MKPGASASEAKQLVSLAGHLLQKPQALSDWALDDPTFLIAPPPLASHAKTKIQRETRARSRKQFQRRRFGLSRKRISFDIETRSVPGRCTPLAARARTRETDVSWFYASGSGNAQRTISHSPRSLSLGSAVSETKRFSLAIKVAQRGSAQKRTRSGERERGFPTSPWKLPRGLLRGCELAEVPRERAITRGQRAARAVPLSLLLLILAAACVSRSHHPDAQSTVTSPTLFRAEQFSRAKSPEDWYYETNNARARARDITHGPSAGQV